VLACALGWTSISKGANVVQPYWSGLATCCGWSETPRSLIYLPLLAIRPDQKLDRELSEPIVTDRERKNDTT